MHVNCITGQSVFSGGLEEPEIVRKLGNEDSQSEVNFDTGTEGLMGVVFHTCELAGFG